MVYFSRELLVPGLVYRPQLMNAVQKMAEGHLAKQVPDEALRAKLTPNYVIGCKRILPSNKWYPAIVQPNVEVVTSGVTAFTPSGVVAADGSVHEVDTVIFATGFHVTETAFAEVDPRARRRAAVRRLERRARRPTAAPRCPTSRTCSCSSGRTPASATTRSCS